MPFDCEKFKSELKDAVAEAEKCGGTGPDVHAEVLNALLTEIRGSWDLPSDALSEVTFVLEKVFPEAKRWRRDLESPTPIGTTYRGSRSP